MPNGTCRPFEFRAFHVRHWPAVSQEIGNRLESCVESVRPCTPVQNGMLAVFINSGGHDYFNHIVVQSSSPLNMDSLKQTWQTVTDRNEILRTGFYHVRDETSPFAMITYKSGTFALPWYERAPSITDGAVSKNERPNGIGTPEQLYQPAWYLTVQSQNTHTTVQFSALHALYDAQSLNLMFKEVSTLYHGKCLSEPIPVSPVLGSIITATAGRDDGLEKSWEELCKNMPATKFPDLNPIRTDTKETHTLTRVCSKSLLAILTGCTEAGITLQAAGQAAWARLLASYVGEAEVTYGVVLSGRSISTEAQNVIFPCLTTVPSRYRVEGENRELVQRIMKLNAFLMKGQHVPLTKLQRMASSDAALFDTLFVYQKLTSTADDQQFWKIVRQAAVIDVRTGIPTAVTI